MAELGLSMDNKNIVRGLWNRTREKLKKEDLNWEMKYMSRHEERASRMSRRAKICLMKEGKDLRGGREAPASC
jgi:hypothetical protein